VTVAPSLRIMGASARVLAQHSRLGRGVPNDSAQRLGNKSTDTVWPMRRVDSRSDAAFTLLGGIALFVFTWFLGIFGGVVLIPLFGRAVSLILYLLIVVASLALIGVGTVRRLRPRRSN
jgi:hypothetical protein